MKKSNENKVTNTTKHETLTALEKAYAINPHGDDCGVAAMTAGTMIAHSVINTIEKAVTADSKKSGHYDSGDSYIAAQTMRTLKRQIEEAKADLKKLTYCNDNGSHTAYNADGEPFTETLDKILLDESFRLAGKDIGDGLDIANQATMLLLDELAEQAKREPGLGPDLTRPYSERQLNRRVRIVDSESKVDMWVDVEVTPITQVYRGVRKYISGNGSIAINPKSGYCYIEDMVTDTETGKTDIIYLRLGRYSSIGGYEKNFNGQPTVITASKADYEWIQEKLDELKLTEKQAAIMKYRLKENKEYGYKAIATALGINQDSVKNSMKEIRRKALRIGLVPRYAK